MGMLELLATLIDAIWAENLYSTQVCTRQLARSNYNLKKLNVGSIYQDKYFLYDLIPKYLAFLTDISQKIEEDLLDYLLDYDFSYRVKSEQTTYAKIKQYFMREQRIGAIAVNKSLNDLIGFRIILVGVEQNTPLITELLCQKCNTRKISRFYFRDDGDYHAIHCYFKLDNYSFPWELQIWDKINKDKNLYAHEEHERQRKVESNDSYDCFG